MRRALALMLCGVVLLAGAPALAALEQDVPVSLTCKSAILIEPMSGQVIFEKNADEKRAVASVTKIMSILLAIESVEQGRCGLDDMVSVSQNASGMGGSQVLLDTGEQQPFSALLKSMIVASANDATVAVAEYLYGSVQAFVQKMNERAAELGMKDTHFVNSTGLPAQGHYASARDVALMSAELARHPLYFEYSGIWMDTLDHGDGRVTELTNTNRLTRLYDGCDGIKTGSTNEAGYCMSASAKRGDMRLIAVVLGAATGKERFQIAAEMMDYGFANYRTYTVAQKGAKVRGALPILRGNKDSVALALGADMTLLINKSEEQAVQLNPTVPESMNAPLKAGEEVGGIEVTLRGMPVGRVPIVTTESVDRWTYQDGLNKVLKRWYYAF